MTDEVDLLTAAKQLQGVPRSGLLVAFASAMLVLEASGVEVAPSAHAILISLTGEVDAQGGRPDVSLDALLGAEATVRDEEIDRLYAELRSLAGRAPEAVPSELYETRLTRLRELQEMEAQEMAAFATQRRQVRPAEVQVILRDVDALLERDEGSARPDRSRRDDG